MGTFRGHIAHGVGIMAIGLWHMLNNARNYAHSPSEFESRPWFAVKGRTRIPKQVELYAIMLFSSISITTELFVSPRRHRPWDPDGSIPLSHMNSMEHATISLFFFVYAGVAVGVDRYRLRIPRGLLHMFAALAFAVELLLFHFHSTEHVGLEGQYHWLFQAVVAVSLGATILEAALPRIPMVALLRSASLFLQGLWLIHMAFVLWIPSFIPKGCALAKKKEVFVAKCSGRDNTARAIGMANLHFSWDLLLVALLTLGMLFFYTSSSANKTGGAYHPLDSSSIDLKDFHTKPRLPRDCDCCDSQDQTDMSASNHDTSHI